MSGLTSCARFLAVAIVVSLIAVAGVHADTGQVLSGTVVSADGPVEGAAVYLNVPDSVIPFRNNCIKITSTDQEGKFNLCVDPLLLKRHPYYSLSLIAYREGYAVGWKAIKTDDLTGCIEIILGQPVTISGKVTDADSKGVPGACVDIEVVSTVNSSPQSYFEGFMTKLTATTDETGAFVIDGLPENMTLGLTVKASDYAVKYISRIRSGSEGVMIKIVPDGRIKGTVRYFDTGKPVPDIKVLALNTISQKGTYKVFATTNKRGEYEIVGIEPGVYNVTTLLARPYETPEWANVTIENIAVEEGKTTENADIELVRGGLVTGTVTDGETGAPLPGVCVAAVRPEMRSGIYCGWTQTDENGEYTVRSTQGEVMVSVKSILEGYFYLGERYDVIVVTNNETTQGVDFKVRKGRAVIGRTIGPDGDVVTDVVIHGWTTSMLKRGSVISDTDGLFTISGLAEGLTFPVEAEHAGKKLRAIATLSSDADEEQVIHLEKYEMATITGRVVDEAQNPVQGAELHLVTYGWNGGSNVLTLPCGTGSDGRFAVRDLVIGKRYSLHITKDNYAETYLSLSPLTLDMQALDDTVLMRAERWLAGTVKDNLGRPVSAALVAINCSPSGFKETVTDKNGYYRFDDLVPIEEPQLSINHHDYGHYIFRCLETNKIHDHTLIKPLHSLTGFVMNSDNEPMDGAIVCIDPQQHESGLVNSRSLTDASGSFYIEHILDEIVDIRIGNYVIGFNLFSDVRLSDVDMTFTVSWPDTTCTPLKSVR